MEQRTASWHLHVHPDGVVRGRFGESGHHDTHALGDCLSGRMSRPDDAEVGAAIAASWQPTFGALQVAVTSVRWSTSGDFAVEADLEAPQWAARGTDGRLRTRLDLLLPPPPVLAERGTLPAGQIRSRFVLALPEGTRLDDGPVARSVESPWGRFVRTVQASERELCVDDLLELRGASLSGDERGVARQFLDEVGRAATLVLVVSREAGWTAAAPPAPVTSPSAPRRDAAGFDPMGWGFLALVWLVVGSAATMGVALVFGKQLTLVVPIVHFAMSMKFYNDFGGSPAEEGDTPKNSAGGKPPIGDATRFLLRVALIGWVATWLVLPAVGLGLVTLLEVRWRGGNALAAAFAVFCWGLFTNWITLRLAQRESRAAS